MGMRSSSLTNNPLAITRELDGRYDVVLEVRDNLDLITQVSGIDFAAILAELESAQDFTGITVVRGETVAWDAVNKILTVPKGDKGDKGDTGDTGLTGPQGIQGPQGIKGDTGLKGDTGSQGPKGFDGAAGAQGLKGDTGDDLTITQITYNGNGTFNWLFSDGTSYVTPSLKGPKGDTGNQGVKGDQGISVHHIKGTSTTDLEGDFATFGETDTYTVYGDAAEEINLGHFRVNNGAAKDGQVGLMYRSTYDTNNTGVVDDSEKLDGHSSDYYVNVVADQSIGGNKTLKGNLTVSGDLVVNGTTVTVNTQTVEVEDNVIVLNNGEVGAGVTSGIAGIEVDRGSEENYKFVFTEADDSFKIGKNSNIQKVATREDTPIDTGIAVWNATANRFDTDRNVDVDSVSFGGNGTVSWNTDESTLDVALGTATLQVGQETLVKVRAGTDISNGRVVMATGSIGNSGRITVTLHDGTKVNGKRILGVATQDISSGTDGFVTAFGKVRNIDTTGSNVGETWADGDVLYVKPSDSGRLTKVAPLDTELNMPVAFVVHAHTNGTLFIRVTGIDENLDKELIATKVDKNAAIVAGTGTKVTYDSKGLVTGSTTLSAGDIPNLDASKITTGTLSLNTTGSAAKLTTARSIAITGDMTWSTSFDGSANVTGVGTLANSGVTAGTYKSVTVDSKGRVTNGTNPTTLSGYGITDTYTKTETNTQISNAISGLVDAAPGTLDTLNELAAALGDDPNFTTTVTNSIATKVVKNTDIVAGTNTKITYDAKGLVTGGSTLSATDIPALDMSKVTTGTLGVTQGGTGVTTSTGSGSVVLSTSPTLVTPSIGVATGISFNSITALSSTNPVVDGTAAVGTSTTVARADHVHPSDITKVTANANITAGTYKSVTVDVKGLVTGGTNPTTLAGYSIADAYTKTESDAALALKVDDTEIASVNLLRADKYLAAQNIASMVYTSGDLTKIQYKNATDVDYEVLNYTSGNLTSINHYTSSVLRGTTTLSYSSGNLVSAIYA